MRSHTTTSPDRRARRIADRRSRRRPAIIAAGLAFGLFASAGMTVTAAASQPEASGRTASFALASFTLPSQVATARADTASDRIAATTRQALTEADAALAAAATVTADIQASGLDIGVPDTTVDTAELEAAVARLQAGAATLPAPLLPDLADDLTPLVAAIDGEVAGLRGSLDAATQRKAAEEAAAQAQREAEAEAEAAAAAAAAAESTAPSSSSSAASSSGTSPTYAAGGTSAADAQAIAHSMIGGYGWGDDQFSCLVSLWNRESGWNVYAGNASGAYGIPQALPGSKMASAGADWQSNPATQISWGLGYISGRYGTPCGAWEHSESSGWY
jgi:hypothetical protein